ncbi:translocation/assembly module TamB domain-containing protein [Puniceibacterium sediminis]|uniref:Translocation and assembly module TamB n=1 Tax=Puniceibacterium sediminis TaxID=1608407 RepID=A0A238WYV5_9RHOB|nr:translocation/assembly module TamB domain-containing protein [Puniceibacterium sediminis]SNR51865.1 translocation and assembly module TamB [Puniceibacterium sediminis]
MTRIRFCLLFFVALFATQPVFSQSSETEEDDRGYLQALLEDNLSAEGRQIRIQGFSGALSSRATIEQLTISDTEGVWITLNDVGLSWNRLAILRGRIEIAELSAKEVLLPRKPVANTALPDPEAKPFSLPELPVSVEIEELNIDRAVLGAPILGVEAVVSVSGSASLADGALDANLQIARIDGMAGELSLKAAYANETKNISLDLSLIEGPGGIVSTLMELPDSPAIALNVQGNGPLDDFSADLSLATDGEDRLNGRLTLAALPDDGPDGSAFSATLSGDIRPMLPPENRAFFGPDLNLDVQGQTLADGRMRLNTLDLTTGSLTLTGNLALGSDKWPEEVELAGRIVNAAGGALLLPLPGVETRIDSLDLDVNFNASDSDSWSADLVLSGLDRPDIKLAQLRLNGLGRLSQGEGTSLGNVAGRFDIGAYGISPTDAKLATALGEAISGDIVFDWNEGAPLDLAPITLTGAGMDLNGSIRITGLSDTFAPQIIGNAELAAVDISRFSGLAGRNLGGAVNLTLTGSTKPLDGAFDATINGSTRDLVTGVAEADRILAGEATLAIDAARDENGILVRTLNIEATGGTLSAEGRLRTSDSAARFDVTLNDTALVLPQLSGPAQVRGQLDQVGTLWTFDTTASGPGDADIRARILASYKDGTVSNINGMGTIEADDIAPYGAIAKRDIAGAVDLAGSGAFDPATQYFSVALTGGATDLQTNVPQVDSLLSGKMTVVLEAERDADGIVVRNLDLQASGLTALASGQQTKDGSLSKFDIRLPDASRIDPRLKGAARAQGTLKQVDTTYTLNTQATGPGGVDVAAEVIAQYSNSVLGQVQGSGTVKAADLAPYSALAQRDIGGAVDLSGSGGYDPATKFFSADIQGSVTDLKTNIDQLDGLLTGRSTIMVDVTKNADGILLRNLDVDASGLIAAANGVLRDTDSSARFDVRLPDASRAVPGLNGAAQVSGTLDQAGDEWTVDATATGPGGVALDASVVAQYADRVFGQITGSGTVKADSLSPYAGLVNRPIGGSLNVTGAGSFDPRDNTFAAEATGTARDLHSGIDAVDKLVAGQADFALNAERDDSGVITVRAFDLTTGQINATVSGALGTASSNLVYDVQLRDLGLFAPGFNGPATASGTASTQGDSYRVDANVSGPGGTNAQVSGTVAPDASSADISATGSAPLALANIFLEPNILSGTADFNLRLNGAPGLDALSGTVRTAGASLVLPSAPLNLNDIDAIITLNSGQANVDLTTQTSTRGTITVRGPITLSAPFNGDLALQLNAVAISDPGLYDTEISGKLTLVGPLASSAALEGTLQMDKVEVRVADTGLGTAGGNFELRHINETAASRQTRARAGRLDKVTDDGGGGLDYSLNVLLKAPSQIFIRGRGLDAELGGEIRLRGTLSDIVPDGRFDLVRGRLDILGQRIELDQASIVMRGSLVPTINIVATTQREDTSIQFEIRGVVYDPDVTISSSPERPEEEVLALLLFGRDVTQISAFQALRLASAINTLVGTGGDGIVERLRMGFGVDDLDVSTAEDGTTELRVGKYLTDNVYTDVTVGAAGQSEINLNLDITSSITARGTASSDGNTGLGLFFEKDY